MMFCNFNCGVKDSLKLLVRGFDATATINSSLRRALCRCLGWVVDSSLGGVPVLEGQASSKNAPTITNSTHRSRSKRSEF